MESTNDSQLITPGWDLSFPKVLGCLVNWNAVHWRHVAFRIFRKPWQNPIYNTKNTYPTIGQSPGACHTWAVVLPAKLQQQKVHPYSLARPTLSKAFGFPPVIWFCFPTSPRSQWPQKGICYGLTSPPVQASQLLPLGPLLCMFSGKNLVESIELCFTAVCLCTKPRRLPDLLAEGVLRMFSDFVNMSTESVMRTSPPPQQ